MQFLHIYSSIHPEDIASDKMTPRGTRELRAYLEFARSGYIEDNTPTGKEPDSDFELFVAQELEDAGFSCEPQLGVAGYRIDIAIRHPEYSNAYLAAIECDGATYHSGKSVRDRDRIRQEVIESLGWRNRIWRIWSTDWFRNPDRETAKLIAWLNQVRARPYDEAFLATEEEDVATPAVSAELPDELSPPEFLQEFSVGVDIEVEVGDTVVYSRLGVEDGDITIHITDQRNNVESGIVWEGTPLAQALLGATAGEEVVLRVPGQPAKKFVIKKIVRPGATH